MRICKTFQHILRFSSAPKRPVPSITEIQDYWSQFSQYYNKFDYCPQTLYYSLLYMLEVWDAKNILEVACGTGKLLPIAAFMKNPNANYLATDLSPSMIQLTKQNLKANLQLYDSKLSFDEWLKKNKIDIMQSNAEEPIKKPTHLTNKFDRIICNCVLMLTENSERMLRNLGEEAEKGCLLGVSVWGNKDNNNLMTSIRESYLEANVQLPEERSNFYLYKKVPALAEKCGWETVLNWQQNALFPALSPSSEKYKSFFFHQIAKIEDEKKREQVKQILLKKLDKFFKDEKRGINFSCQLLVLRKK